MLKGAWFWLLEVAGRGFDPNGIQLQVGRSVLALGTVVTLLLNSEATLSHNPDPSERNFYKCSDLYRFGLFCLTSESPHLARFLGVAVCLLVIVGVVPAVTGILFWYVTASVFANAGPVDGGDQITACLAFVLAIIGAADRRLWAWKCSSSRPAELGRFSNGIWLLLPTQLAFVYLNSAIAKFSAPVWVEGTGLWYWVQHPGFNAWGPVRTSGLDVLAQPLVSALFTWGVIGFELGLAAVIILGHASRRLRLIALAAGLTFHLAIAVTIGLISFGFAMSGGLLLALWRPRDALPWTLFRMTRNRKTALAR
jgi:antimicrobial peptide system SdpB family protein